MNGGAVSAPAAQDRFASAGLLYGACGPGLVEFSAPVPRPGAAQRPGFAVGNFRRHYEATCTR